MSRPVMLLCMALVGVWCRASDLSDVHGADHHHDHHHEDHSEVTTTELPVTMMIKQLVQEDARPMMVKPLAEPDAPFMMVKQLVQQVAQPMMVKQLVQQDAQPMMVKKMLQQESGPAKPMVKAVEDKKAKASSVNDGGRPLSLPDMDSCINRPKQWKMNNHWYFLSSTLEESNKTDWLDARNLCRKHCMDAVSIETIEENDMVNEVIRTAKLPFVWTSGRLCDFKGCNRPDLEPKNILGWFWSGSGVKIAPTNASPAGWGYNPWSATGHLSIPQPDNAEFGINNTTESCLAVLNSVYKKGDTAWHDIACYHSKYVICEDSPPLLKYIRELAVRQKLTIEL